MALGRARSGDDLFVRVLIVALLTVTGILISETKVGELRFEVLTSSHELPRGIPSVGV